MANAPKEMSEASTLLSMLLETAPISFVFIDREFRILRLNEACTEFTNTPMEQVVGRIVAEVAPEQWPRAQEIYRRVLDHGDIVRNVPWVRPMAGNSLDLHEWLASYYPVRVGRDIIGIGVVGVDITERVRAEHFRSAVMSQVADGVFTQDGDGLLTYMNDAAAEMLGWSEAQLRGRRVHDVFHFQTLDGRPVNADECPMLTQATQGRVIRITADAFTRRDGSIFPVAYSAVPLNIGPRSDGVAVVFRDIGRPDAHSTMIRVMIVEGRRKVSELFSALLSMEEGVNVVSVVATSEDAVASVRALKPDVVIVDYDLMDIDGVEAARIIKLRVPTASVILMTESYDQSVAIAGIAAGCAAVLDTDRAWVELLTTVGAAYHGETTISQAELRGVLAGVQTAPSHGRPDRLTSREIDVLTCLLEGLSNRSAGERLGVSANTIRNHVQRILWKLNVHSKLEAVFVARRDGLAAKKSPDR